MDNWIEHTPAKNGDAHPLFRRGVECEWFDDSDWRPIRFITVWKEGRPYRFKVEPHVAAEEGWPVVLLDAGGREVPAKFVVGPDSDGDYQWRIMGEHQIYENGSQWPYNRRCYFKPDGTKKFWKARLIVKQPEQPAATDPTQESGYEAKFPKGTKVRFKSETGPQWRGTVCGYYSTAITPEGLVVECDVEGVKGIVHVDPAKRFVMIEEPAPVGPLRVVAVLAAVSLTVVAAYLWRKK